MSITLLKKSMEILKDDLSDKKQSSVPFSRNKVQKSKGKKNPHLAVIRGKKCVQYPSHENIQKFLSLSNNTNCLRDAEKIVNHANKRCIQDEVIVEKGSIFTEEDFDAFEREFLKAT